MSTYIPENYKSLLTIYDTQKAISLLKRLFEETSARSLTCIAFPRRCLSTKSPV